MKHYQGVEYCPGPLNRRSWIKLGGLSLGSLITGSNPGLAQILALENQIGHRSNNFSVILFWANGGPSHLDLFDLKPEAPTEYRGPFKPISTTVPGMEITEMLPRIAALGEQFTLVRSFHHERVEHSGGTHRFLTGYASRQANLKHSEFPDLGSIVSRNLEHLQKDLPLYIANTKAYGSGPAYLGTAHAPYMPNPNPLTSTGNNSYDPVPLYSVPGQSDNLSITLSESHKLLTRRGLMRALDTLPRQMERNLNLQSLDILQQRALNMLTSSRTREAFDLSRENTKTRNRYGNTHWGKSLLTCRRLVEAGVRFVQCQATFRLRKETGRTSNWDDHSVNSNIFSAYREKLPFFDESVSALISDLYDRGMDQNVLFVFCGEFGRTPMIRNQDVSGRPGRDHWSRSMCVFLSGGGLKMGQVIGATNRRAEEPVDRIMDSNDFLATIYNRFGIDSAQSYDDHAGRPIPILTNGAPIPELL